MNDIVVNKVQSIQRCAERASEEYRLAGTTSRRTRRAKTRRF